jgi:predicted nucleotidyltransferase
MIKEVLTSKSKVNIIEFFCKFPYRKFQMIEVAKHCELSNSRTSECLRELAGFGILESKKIGKGHEYGLNLSNYFSKLFLQLFRGERKLVDVIAKDFVDEVKIIPAVQSIVLFGSALTQLKISSDIDFLVVSKKIIEREKISLIETKLIDKYGFHISTTLMTKNEIKEKARKGEEFTINVIANGRLLFGKNLEDMIWQGK